MILKFTVNVFGESIETDSVIIHKGLNELTVTAPEKINYGNKTAYFPSNILKNSTNSCVQMLAALQIPEIIVNPTTGTISISGGGKLTFRINGRPATNIDLASLSSKEITKVEYITTPGIKYGDAEGVLEITVKNENQDMMSWSTSCNLQTEAGETILLH